MENKGLISPQCRDEDAARQHIEKTVWPDGPICPHCGLIGEAVKLEPRSEGKTHVRKGVWQCNGCRKQFTVTVGTIFEDSHIPLHKWLLAIHLMCSSKKGMSAHQLMRNLGIGSYRTAWFMAHRIRWALTQPPIKEKLSGIVEIDETYIGGKMRTGPHAVKPNERPRDRLPAIANKVPVVAVLQRGGSVRSQQVERVTAKELKPIVSAMVKQHAHLMTDSSTVLEGAVTGLKHDHVNHSAREYTRRENGTLISTNSVESYFATVKRGHYGVYHHWSKKYTARYLQEFDWRYNVRKLDDMERAIVALKMTSGKRLMLKATSPTSASKG